VVRDQQIASFGTSTFRVTGSVAGDGRLLSSGFASPYSKSLAYTGWYDTAGRPVNIDAGGISVWRVQNSAKNSYDGYDALGRTPLVQSNNGKVDTFRTYAQFSGALSSQVTSFNQTATAIYGVDTLVYAGLKLKSYRETTVAGTTSSHAFGYDQGGRLVTATAAKTGTAPLMQSFTESYSHGDSSWPTGASMENLESVTDATGTTGYAYMADRVTQQTGAKAFAWQYDGAGRLAMKSLLNATTELEGYSYDVQDQLTQARVSTGATEYLEYDPSGLPLFRKVGTKGTWYIGTNATVTADVSSTCTGTASCLPIAGTERVGVHVQLGGTRVATIQAPRPAEAADPYSEVLYYHRDQQGSVVGTSRRSAGVDGLAGARYRYTPWGQLDKVDGVSAASDSELGFTGGLRLGYQPGAVATLTAPQPRGLLLLGARVYHPELKRWLVPDTVDGRRYSYTGGDPVNFVDPSGRKPMKPMLVPTIMAELYYRTFYGDPSRFGSWNLFVGSGGYDARVGNTTLGIGLRDPLEERDGTNWIPCPGDARKTCSTLTAQLSLPGFTTSDEVADTAPVVMDTQTVYTGKPWYALKQESWEARLWEAELALYRERGELKYSTLLVFAGAYYSTDLRNKLVPAKSLIGNVRYTVGHWSNLAEASRGLAGIAWDLGQITPVWNALESGWALGRRIDDFFEPRVTGGEYGRAWETCP
jgi:RHS repeat-associated protein